MEIFILVVSLFLAVLIYAVAKLVSSNQSSSQHEIPGPRKLPVIGNLHLLAGRSLPHHVFRDLADKYGPLMRLQLGQVPFLIASSVEVAKQVLRTHDVIFANRIPVLVSKTLSYNNQDIGVAPYGEHWRQLRRICTLELLSPRRVRSFRAIREEENLNLAKWIASHAGSAANLSEQLYLSSVDVITRSTIGDKSEDQSRFTWAMQETLKLISGLSIVDLFPSNRLLPLVTGINYKIAKIFRVTDEVLQSIIDRHRAAADDDDATTMESRSEDLVDVLLKYQQNDNSLQFQITTEAIKAVILDMLFGGADTSATVVEWAMSEMIRNPSKLRRAQEEVRQVLDDKGCVDEEKFDEMKYLKLVIKETLRLHPPLPLIMPRMSSEQCEINGHKIAAGSRVIINAWAIGRDPKYWDEAEAFKPERFEESSIDFKGNNLEYIPFGSGRRICPGMSFGLASVEFTLATLLYHFDWEMPNGIKNEDLDMTEAFGLTVNRKRHLLLIPTVRTPLP